ncbi:ly6/PLAUR domain-containing protein 6B isoform X6 [Ornithorhynchus anatinus]|uniref:ly6/PLAUR domain-containing protein 6B isoform X6 n=1 Tax=Ornithorhynchus anatinus TaxID=9258 RepID=UPI0019D4CBA0|nr:ly6/PLAUR domain-containing protein 6B isoform X6 [Ornithorhynchus anatinus]
MEADWCHSRLNQSPGLGHAQARRRHAISVPCVSHGFPSDLRLCRKLGSSQEHQLLQREASSRPFKCFTCDRAADNYNCNRWAEDKWCPPSAQYCMTVHHFTNHGRSTSVTKKCASKSDCHFVGCQHHQESGRTECRSCCEGMICNIEVPTNHTNAVLVVLPALRASSGAARTPGLSMLALGLAARWL